MDYTFSYRVIAWVVFGVAALANLSGTITVEYSIHLTSLAVFFMANAIYEAVVSAREEER